jgi:MFS family permease
MTHRRHCACRALSAPLQDIALAGVLIASVAAFLVQLDATMLCGFRRAACRLPEATAADMSWVLNAYTVVYAAMLIPAGGLADAHGRKRVFLFGVSSSLRRRRVDWPPGLAGSRACCSGGRC